MKLLPVVKKYKYRVMRRAVVTPVGHRCVTHLYALPAIRAICAASF